MSTFQEAANELDALKTRVAELERLVSGLHGTNAAVTSIGVPRSHYRTSEVAEIWGVRTSTVQRWVRDGRIEAVDMGSWYAVPAEVVQQGPPMRRAS